MNLFEIGKLWEDGLVTERDIDDAVVSEGRHSGNRSRLLSSAWCASAHEQTGILSPVSACTPDTASLVPKRLPLRGKIAVSKKSNLV
jgi:hypothetical protein